MNKKQYKTFGITSLILSVYFYVWGVMDSIAVLKYSQATFTDVLWAGELQQIICIILFGFGVAFLINSGLENEK